MSMKWTRKLLVTAVMVTTVGSGTVAALAATSNNAASTSTSQTATGVPGAGGGMGFGAKGHRSPMLSPVTVAAQALGMSEQTLRSDLESGKSIVQVAKEKGVNEATLETKMKADFATALQSQQSQRESAFSSHLTQILEQTGLPGLAQRQGGPRMGGAALGPMQAAADVLAMSIQTLHSDLASGKSLASIASAKGISESTLISKLEGAVQVQLDTAVKSGNLTQAQADVRMQNFKQHVNTMVEHTGTAPLPANQ